ncbi:MAG: peptidoglycan-binding protein [Alphaproteobacteria bacterium]|nr:peptidoglycan-binding protein [Alphaproteobacteria bacterium]
MVGKTGTSKQQTAKEAALSLLPHQERVNIEMFRAIEVLGKKLERVEEERDSLARRLALIESAATVDEKTGKLYLPVSVDPATQTAMPIDGNAPKWTVTASLMSSALALVALSIVVFRDPVQPGLTRQQLAALDRLDQLQTQVAQLEQERASWRNVKDVPQQATETARPSQQFEIEVPYGIDIAALPDVESLTPEETVAEPPVETVSAEPDDTPDYEVAEVIEIAPASSVIASEDVVAAAESVAAIAPASGEMVEAAEEELIEQAQVEEIPPAPVKPKVAVKTAPPVEAAPVAPVTVEIAPAKVSPAKSAPAKVAAAPAKPTPVPQVEDSVVEIAPAAETKPAPVAAPARSGRVDTAPARIGVIARDPNLPRKLADMEARAFEGVHEAQHDLGTLYAAGELVAQDFKRAAYWFGRASEGGIANADYNLGVMFQQGMGVGRDVNKAMGWYKRSAKQGHPEAMYNLGIAYVEGIGAKRDINRGVAWFKQAANAGVSQAAFNLGVLYESGFVGSGVDLDGAAEWYQVAANEGHDDASAAVRRIKQQMVAVADRDYALSVASIAPASGGVGEGDISPVEESGRAAPPSFAGNIVADTQAELVRLGFLPQGSTSGAMDDRTGDAIRAFQRRSSLAVDGTPSDGLLEKLRTAR